MLYLCYINSLHSGEIHLGILTRIFKEITKPAVNEFRGKMGERSVHYSLNPLLLGKREHRQINNLMLKDDLGKTHQIDHIEIRENGIFCIETKNYKGWIFGSENQDRWTQTLTTEKHQFLNPLKQNKTHIYHLNKILSNKYEIHSLIVFVQNNADRIKIPNVINLKDLKHYLDHFSSDVRYSTEEMDKIFNILVNEHQKDISTREHVRNIRATQKELKEGVCPRCGGKLIEKKGKYGSFYGCANYPKCTFILKKKGERA